jgi:Glycosyl hydrolase family 12
MRALITPSLLAALSLAGLMTACSDGDLDRADGPPTFDGNANDPYTPSTSNPPPTNPNTPNTNGQTPNGQTPTGQTPSTGNENEDDDVPLDPTAPATSQLGEAMMGGEGTTTQRYHKTAVTRDGKNYFLMANGWGPGFQSQSLAWSGTSFTVQSLQGAQGPNYEPASYPTVFCGAYSDSRSGECGLPAALDSMAALRTGWSWRDNGNQGQYNAAYDIWLGTSADRSSFSGYLMVWYREPAGQQPAGRLTTPNVTVANVDGSWNIWQGEVGGRPIINWVRAEGQDTPSMEFDILDFVRDAETRGLTVPGSHVLSVAVGFEIWNGPITNLESVDFYVDVQ